MERHKRTRIVICLVVSISLAAIACALTIWLFIGCYSDLVVSANWGAWNNWGICSASCGGGYQNRSRECDAGDGCSLPEYERQECNTEPCPVDGEWGSWGNWGICSATCDNASQNRIRACDGPSPQNGGEDCPGPAFENQDCNVGPCPINGEWGIWENWGTCSATCGGGTQDRSRVCDRPSPQNGGTDCIPPGSDSRTCNTDPCPITVDGKWGSWNGWSTCTVTCGGGTQSKSRDCDNPSPLNGGEDCLGSASEIQDCNTDPCPINGEWRIWDEWSTCSATCEGGTQARSRVCDSPSPQNGGSDCTPPESDSRICNTDPCPINGEWGNWNSWSTCSVTCGVGSQSRMRACDSPSPQHGGNDCPAPDSGEHTHPVVFEGIWGSYGATDFCPNLGLITSFKTKAGNAGVGVTGLEVKCSDGTILHGWGGENPYGEWATAYQHCDGGYSAFRLDWVPYQGTSNPDPAVICLEMLCSYDNSWHKSSCTEHANSKQHGPYTCPAGNIFCSLTQAVEEGDSDNSGLNSIKLDCCDTGSGQEMPCSPGACPTVPTEPAIFEGIWGSFGTMEECPYLGMITSFKTKAGDAGVGVTGLEVKCSDGAILHGWGGENPYGEWATEYQNCNGGYTAFRLDWVPYQGTSNPDPAVICLEMLCSNDDSWHKSSCTDHANSEEHGPFACPDEKRLCTLAQAVEEGDSDNTGLNSIEMRCCD